MKLIRLLKGAEVLGEKHDTGAVLELTDADDIADELVTKGLAEPIESIKEVEAEVTKAAARIVETATAVEPEVKARRPQAVLTGADMSEPVDRPGRGFKSAGSFFADVAHQAMGRGTSEALKSWDAYTKAATGLNETFGSDGGFLVPPEMAAGIYTIQHEQANLASRCRTIPINQNLTMNAIDETSRVTGSRWGGIATYWQSEAQQAVASRPKFRQMNFVLKKLVSAVYATEELLADASALEGVINQAVGEEFAWTIDESIFTGNGAGQPLGILNSACLVTVDAEVGQLADTIVAENIWNMWFRMPSANRNRAVWLVSQTAEAQLQQMAAPAGQLIYLPQGGLSATPYGTLLGRPVLSNEHSLAVGDLGDVVLADLGEYIYTPKSDGVQAASSIHVQFLAGETIYRFTQRVDGQPGWAAPLTPAKGAATLSPFVTLEAR